MKWITVSLLCMANAAARFVAEHSAPSHSLIQLECTDWE